MASVKITKPQNKPVLTRESAAAELPEWYKEPILDRYRRMAQGGR